MPDVKVGAISNVLKNSQQHQSLDSIHKQDPSSCRRALQRHVQAQSCQQVSPWVADVHGHVLNTAAWMKLKPGSYYCFES